ncbi:hypothetical protein TREMEDRAFT_62472 [Tremella mesenterica DSM 1558]|uniref:uncharacterized protein n=1 Tax=Tremella mesenterica (strain ATCC 24925 / CBS 8224 / DSM 1558 / NBRC 9311 / NRRL Y-6157 / RJB 2259-6 / UBC 559-6) TaxID=578456 RepID=UPI0003F4A4E1|nr:uncharacterized protein TREMEDRAFT_62472 [Tremella mesenterica DSM 1558]EIW69605.1 hypothetical protein TREMEDRAFT_62472 [Tremella mesenterica DSM 1558]
MQHHHHRNARPAIRFSVTPDPSDLNYQLSFTLERGPGNPFYLCTCEQQSVATIIDLEPNTNAAGVISNIFNGGPDNSQRRSEPLLGRRVTQDDFETAVQLTQPVSLNSMDALQNSVWHKLKETILQRLAGEELFVTEYRFKTGDYRSLDPSKEDRTQGTESIVLMTRQDCERARQPVAPVMVYYRRVR